VYGIRAGRKQKSHIFVFRMSSNEPQRIPGTERNGCWCVSKKGRPGHNHHHLVVVGVRWRERALDLSLIGVGDRSVGLRWPSPARQTGRHRYAAHHLNCIICITERITSARQNDQSGVPCACRQNSGAGGMVGGG